MAPGGTTSPPQHVADAEPSRDLLGAWDAKVLGIAWLSAMTKACTQPTAQHEQQQRQQQEKEQQHTQRRAVPQRQRGWLACSPWMACWKPCTSGHIHTPCFRPSHHHREELGGSSPSSLSSVGSFGSSSNGKRQQAIPSASGRSYVPRRHQHPRLGSAAAKQLPLSASCTLDPNVPPAADHLSSSDTLRTSAGSRHSPLPCSPLPVQDRKVAGDGCGDGREAPAPSRRFSTAYPITQNRHTLSRHHGAQLDAHQGMHRGSHDALLAWSAELSRRRPRGLGAGAGSAAGAPATVGDAADRGATASASAGGGGGGGAAADAAAAGDGAGGHGVTTAGAPVDHMAAGAAPAGSDTIQVTAKMSAMGQAAPTAEAVAAAAALRRGGDGGAAASVHDGSHAAAGAPAPAPAPEAATAVAGEFQLFQNQAFDVADRVHPSSSATTAAASTAASPGFSCIAAIPLTLSGGGTGGTGGASLVQEGPGVLLVGWPGDLGLAGGGGQYRGPVGVGGEEDEDEDDRLSLPGRPGIIMPYPTALWRSVTEAVRVNTLWRRVSQAAEATQKYAEAAAAAAAVAAQAAAASGGAGAASGGGDDGWGAEATVAAAAAAQTAAASGAGTGGGSESAGVSLRPAALGAAVCSIETQTGDNLEQAEVPPPLELEPGKAQMRRGQPALTAQQSQGLQGREAAQAAQKTDGLQPRIEQSRTAPSSRSWRRSAQGSRAPAAPPSPSPKHASRPVQVSAAQHAPAGRPVATAGGVPVSSAQALQDRCCQAPPAWSNAGVKRRGGGAVQSGISKAGLVPPVQSSRVGSGQDAPALSGNDAHRRGRGAVPLGRAAAGAGALKVSGNGAAAALQRGTVAKAGFAGTGTAGRSSGGAVAPAAASAAEASAAGAGSGRSLTAGGAGPSQESSKPDPHRHSGRTAVRDAPRPWHRGASNGGQRLGGGAAVGGDAGGGAGAPQLPTAMAAIPGAAASAATAASAAFASAAASAAAPSSAWAALSAAAAVSATSVRLPGAAAPGSRLPPPPAVTAASAEKSIWQQLSPDSSSRAKLWGAPSVTASLEVQGSRARDTGRGGRSTGGGAAGGGFSLIGSGRQRRSVQAGALVSSDPQPCELVSKAPYSGVTVSNAPQPSEPEAMTCQPSDLESKCSRQSELLQSCELEHPEHPEQTEQLEPFSADLEAGRQGCGVEGGQERPGASSLGGPGEVMQGGQAGLGGGSRGCEVEVVEGSQGCEVEVVQGSQGCKVEVIEKGSAGAGAHVEWPASAPDDKETEEAGREAVPAAVPVSATPTPSAVTALAAFAITPGAGTSGMPAGDLSLRPSDPLSSQGATSLSEQASERGASASSQPLTLAESIRPVPTAGTARPLSSAAAGGSTTSLAALVSLILAPGSDSDAEAEAAEIRQSGAEAIAAEDGRSREGAEAAETKRLGVEAGAAETKLLGLEAGAAESKCLKSEAGAAETKRLGSEEGAAESKRLKLEAGAAETKRLGLEAEAAEIKHLEAEAGAAENKGIRAGSEATGSGHGWEPLVHEAGSQGASTSTTLPTPASHPLAVSPHLLATPLDATPIPAPTAPLQDLGSSSASTNASYPPYTSSMDLRGVRSPAPLLSTACSRPGMGVGLGVGSNGPSAVPVLPLSALVSRLLLTSSSSSDGGSNVGEGRRSSRGSRGMEGRGGSRSSGGSRGSGGGIAAGLARGRSRGASEGASSSADSSSQSSCSSKSNGSGSSGTGTDKHGGSDSRRFGTSSGVGCNSGCGVSGRNSGSSDSGSNDGSRNSGSDDGSGDSGSSDDGSNGEIGWPRRHAAACGAGMLFHFSTDEPNAPGPCTYADNRRRSGAAPPEQVEQARFSTFQVLHLCRSSVTEGVARSDLPALPCSSGGSTSAAPVAAATADSSPFALPLAQAAVSVPPLDPVYYAGSATSVFRLPSLPQVSVSGAGQGGQGCSIDVELQEHEEREQRQLRVEQVKRLLQSLESGETLAGDFGGYGERDEGSSSDSAGSAKSFAGWLSDRQVGPVGGVEAKEGGLAQRHLHAFSSGDSSDADDSRGYGNISLLCSTDADDSDGSGDGSGSSASSSGDDGSSDGNDGDGNGDSCDSSGSGDTSGSDDGSGSDGGSGDGSGSGDISSSFTVGQEGGDLAKGAVGFGGSAPQGSRSCSCSDSGGSSDTEEYAPALHHTDHSNHSLCS